MAVACVVLVPCPRVRRTQAPRQEKSPACACADRAPRFSWFRKVEVYFIRASRDSAFLLQSKIVTECRPLENEEFQIAPETPCDTPNTNGEHFQRVVHVYANADVHLRMFPKFLHSFGGSFCGDALPIRSAFNRPPRSAKSSSASRSTSSRANVKALEYSPIFVR